LKFLKHSELIFWLSGLIALALTNPENHHFTFCPLANFGFSWCPGCGLGRSISSIFRGDMMLSLSYHWFGLPAFIILIHRVYVLSKKYLYLSES
jgi:hypothetical protein